MADKEIEWLDYPANIPHLPIGENVLICEVKNAEGVVDKTLYGTSGFMGEPIKFFDPSKRRFKADEITQFRIIQLTA